MESTPLLSAADGLPGPPVMQDHPPFLRASHSPWRCIPQNVLVILRGIILAYLVAITVITGHYKATEESAKNPLSHLFDFSLINLAIVLLFHLVTFSWTFTHLYHPDPEENRGGFEYWLVRAMSLPRNMGSLRKQFYFTMLYTTAYVFSFMDSAVYWLVTRQHEATSTAREPSIDPGTTFSAAAMFPDSPFSGLFGEGWFKPFVLVNLHGAPSLIMVLESLLLNSIKRPIALGYHIFGLMFLSGLYLAWAAIAKKVTGSFPFFWLDEAEAGSKEAVTMYCIGFVLLSTLMFALMQGFVGIRECFTRRRPAKDGGADTDESLNS